MRHFRLECFKEAILLSQLLLEILLIQDVLGASPVSPGLRAAISLVHCPIEIPTQEGQGIVPRLQASGDPQSEVVPEMFLRFTAGTRARKDFGQFTGRYFISRVGVDRADVQTPLRAAKAQEKGTSFPNVLRSTDSKLIP